MNENVSKRSVKTLCLGVALVTAWGVGETKGLFVVGDEYVFSGSIAPAASDLSNIYLLYGTGFSASLTFFDTIPLGAVSAGNTLPFSETAFVESGNDNGLIVIGTYGDTTGGFNDGVNGVSMTMDTLYGEGVPPLYQQPSYDHWDDYFSTAESVVFGYLTTGDTAGLETFYGNEIYTQYDQLFVYSETPVTKDRILLNFSDVADGGSASITTVVPEPSTMTLTALGLLAVFGRRKRRS